MTNTEGGLAAGGSQPPRASAYSVSHSVSDCKHSNYGTFMENIARQIGPLCKEEPKESRPVFLINRPDDLQVWQKRKDRQVKALLTLNMAQDKELVFMQLSGLMSEINKIVYSTNI